ncbi:MAG: CPBP family intramembrane metalloprotease [Planctomycetia bacterium]|nr:CPBP family intramembrane metalloprotease [Planctomycetia bacterium]
MHQPDPTSREVLANFLVLGLLLFGSIPAWIYILRRLSQRLPLLAFEPRQVVPWRWPQVVLGFLLCALLPLAVILLSMGQGALREMDAGASQQVLAINTVASAAAAAAVLLLILLTSRATAVDLGVARSSGLAGSRMSDVRTGFVAFVAIAPVVYGVKWLVAPFSDQSHPLEVMLRQNPSTGLLIWVSIAAILVAPIVEEFLFRIVLQGWLERCFMPRVAATPTAEAAPDSTDLYAVSVSPAGFDPANPYSSPEYFGSAQVVAQPVEAGNADSSLSSPAPFTWSLQTAMPIAISSLIFAAMHIGHGLDPIPLFLLALVLGYLYQRTHQLLPSVIVHMSLNAVSVGLLWLSVGH